MRGTLILLVTLACGESRPALEPISSTAPASPPAPAPAPPVLEGMSEQRRCDATFDRAQPCSDDLLRAQLVQIDDTGGLANVFDEKHARDTRPTRDEAARMHEDRCLGDDGYPAAIVACWDEQPCAQFAACVTRRIR